MDLTEEIKRKAAHVSGVSISNGYTKPWTEQDEKRWDEFREELRGLLNRYSIENASNTQDFVLRDYLVSCLVAYNTAVNKKELLSKRD